ncbi:hypothetical protein TRFO_02938 [Tritrichomonas foetus]|uniref:Uncharacterized protein n=1 Tax=Tritrichomonas foetus TaxID=1144522 RepID=A0A1J4KWN6_9EUKA|nr:hypothetical protein TRFO_02938 [Tritrichomonas foetus]|eukprot:OHT15578.1 hypothetical protein TRFO_02938 [Tritrichomonas foetus]
MILKRYFYFIVPLFQYIDKNMKMKKGNLRKNSFSVEIETDISKFSWRFSTIFLFLLSILVIFAMYYFSAIMRSISNKIYDQKIGSCYSYSCNSSQSKLAILIPFYTKQISKFDDFLHHLSKNTKNTKFGNNTDLIIFPVFKSHENFKIEKIDGNEKIREIQQIVKKSKISSYFSDVKITSLDNIFTIRELFNKIFEDGLPILEPHCFIQFLSLNTHILNKKWIKILNKNSINATSQNFWMKGPTDFSFRPFSQYENIEISFFSLYALRSQCFSNLISMADDKMPTRRIEESLTRLLRSSAETRLSHMLAPRLIPATYAVNFGSSKIGLNEIKKSFPDAYFVEGSKVYDDSGSNE